MPNSGAAQEAAIGAAAVRNGHQPGGEVAYQQEWARCLLRHCHYDNTNDIFNPTFPLAVVAERVCGEIGEPSSEPEARLRVSAPTYVGLQTFAPQEGLGEWFGDTNAPVNSLFALSQVSRTPFPDEDHAVDGCENDVHYFSNAFFLGPVLQILRADGEAGAAAVRRAQSGSVGSVSPAIQSAIRRQVGAVIRAGEAPAPGDKGDDARNDPVKELRRRVYWDASVNGDAPFLFAYTTVGRVLTLWVFRWKDEEFLDIDLARVKDFNMATPQGRLELVFASVRVACISRALVDMLAKTPARGLKDTCKILGDRGFAMKIESRWRKDHIIWDDVEAMYDLKLRNCPALVDSILRETGTVITRPIGHPRLPKTTTDLVVLTGCVLEALDGLHRAGFVHRDVRLPNVVRLSDGRWMLIDLEFGRKLGEDGTTDWPTFIQEQHLPDPPEARWRPRHDLWQFGRSLQCQVEEKWTIDQRAREEGEALQRMRETWTVLMSSDASVSRALTVLQGGVEAVNTSTSG